VKVFIQGTPIQPKPKGIGRSLPLDPAQSIKNKTPEIVALVFACEGTD